MLNNCLLWFDLSSGANAGADTHSFSPQQTTYDYDSPLTEAGDYRPKYYAIMDVIAKYAPIPKVTPPPAPDKYAYGKVLMHKVIIDVTKLIVLFLANGLEVKFTSHLVRYGR